MFWKKKSSTEGKSTSAVEKLPGPQDIPAIAQKYITNHWKIDPDLVHLLKAVVRKNETNGFIIRIFDESDAGARKVQVKNYTSLDQSPELIIYEGSFDEGSKQVELTEKRIVNWDTPIFSKDEIQKKIEALAQLGSTVFFYQSNGPQYGGPLGKGATIVELNPEYLEKKGKKYNIYTADVIDIQPVDKGTKLFDSNKSKEVAEWIKEKHHKRTYS